MIRLVNVFSTSCLYIDALLKLPCLSPFASCFVELLPYYFQLGYHIHHCVHVRVCWIRESVWLFISIRLTSLWKLSHLGFNFSFGRKANRQELICSEWMCFDRGLFHQSARCILIQKEGNNQRVSCKTYSVVFFYRSGS